MNLKKLTSFGVAAAVGLATATILSAEPPTAPDLGDIINEFREAQQALVQERRDLAESLRDATPEERRAAIDAYLEENADRIALHRALSEQIRELMKESRPGAPNGPGVLSAGERPEVPDRPETPTAVQDLIDEFRDVRDGLIQERRDLLADMRDATDEERAAALAELREKNEEIVAQQKELAEQIRDAVQEIREDRRND